MTNPKKIIGQRFNRLQVIEFHSYRYSKEKRRRKIEMYKCICDCETICLVSKDSLIYGHTGSCGCLKKEQARVRGQKSLSKLSKDERKLAKQNSNISNGYVNSTQYTAITKTTANKNSKTGIRGVYPARNGKYRSSIQFQNKVYNLGYYDTIEQATAIRKKSEEMLFEPFIEWYEELKLKEKNIETNDTNGIGADKIG